VPKVIHDCEGAPRDLGLDQGRGFRADLQARYRNEARWRRGLFRLGRGDARTRRLDRDLRRHFPQQSETLDGMKRGAGVPRGWLVAMLDRAVAGEPHARVDETAGAGLEPALAGGSALLLRTFAAEPIARRSRPDGGFASLELSLPWLTSALVGVNEGGLAVASLSLAPAVSGADCAAPAALLAQDCLARFDSRDGAIDWCLGRPAGGRAAILLADESGVAAVEVDGVARRVVLPKDGLLLQGIGAVDAADALRSGAPLDALRLTQVLGGYVACLDPAGRRLGFRWADSKAFAWLDVRACAPG
jgi:hypothetical protein